MSLKSSSTLGMTSRSRSIIGFTCRISTQTWTSVGVLHFGATTRFEAKGLGLPINSGPIE